MDFPEIWEEVCFGTGNSFWWFSDSHKHKISAPFYYFSPVSRTKILALFCKAYQVVAEYVYHVDLQMIVRHFKISDVLSKLCMLVSLGRSG